MKNVKTTCAGRYGVLLTQPGCQPKNDGPLHERPQESAVTQVGVKIRRCRIRLDGCENFTKNPKPQAHSGLPSHARR